MPSASPYPLLLVPVDYAGCAYAVAEHAARMAAAFDSDVVLLHVIEPPAGVHPDDPIEGAPALAAIEAEARTELEAIATVFPNPARVRVLLRVGHPVSGVLTAARETRASLIVMGTHGRGGLRRLLLGSVAERVVRESPTPVLVIHGAPGTADEHSEAWQAAQAETDG